MNIKNTTGYKLKDQYFLLSAGFTNIEIEKIYEKKNIICYSTATSSYFPIQQMRIVEAKAKAKQQSVVSRVSLDRHTEVGRPTRAGGASRAPAPLPRVPLRLHP